MTTLRQAWAHLVSYFRKQELDREFDEELAAHIELATEDHVRQGMALPEARRLALIKLGGIEPSKEIYRESRGLPWLDGIVQDIRYAVRTLRSSPGFTVTAVAMLAVGIGINATVFTVTNAVLFKGFPLVARNDRMAYISNNGCCVSYADFEDYRAQANSFEGMAIVHGVGKLLSDGSGFPDRIDVTEVSADTFRLVGQSPILGRDFAPSDEIPGAAPVAILSYGFWDRRYAKDRAVIGRAVRMNGTSTIVIGVMAQGFSFPQKADMWVPLVPTASVRNRGNRQTWFAFGPLAKGVTIQAARAEIETIAKRLAIAYAVTNRDVKPAVGHFHEFFIGPNAVMIYGALWGAVGFVLLIACANLANLLLARAVGRSREISVRIALGAGRWRIIRQLLIESLMLSGLGGFLGWWIARGGLGGYEIAMAKKSSWLIVDYTMDHRVLGYFIAISIVTGLLFGLAPAWRLSKLEINAALKDGGRGSTVGRGKHLSALLVTGEMALAMVLLAGAGMTIRSFLKVHLANVGFNPDNVVTALVELPVERYPGTEEKLPFFNRLAAGLEAVPGVESVAFGSVPPASGPQKRAYEVAGASEREDPRPEVSALVVSPEYFRTLEATLLFGRDFNNHDGPSASPVVIVNQIFAAHYWPGEEPLGKRLRLFEGKSPEAWRTVVGVVSNIVQDDRTRQRFDPAVYVPRLQQKAIAGAWVFVRTRVLPGTFAPILRREVQALDPDLPVYGSMPLASALRFDGDTQFYGSLFAIFAAIALLLASGGLYAVVAHSVSRRTQEIGVRMALGATARDVLQLVFSQGMLPLGMGLTIGLAASFAVNPILKSLLVQVSPSDPVTLAIASGVLAFSAVLGCWIPARRAMRVDPVVALRHE